MSANIRRIFFCLVKSQYQSDYEKHSSSLTASSQFLNLLFLHRCFELNNTITSFMEPVCHLFYIYLLHPVMDGTNFNIIALGLLIYLTGGEHENVS